MRARACDRAQEEIDAYHQVLGVWCLTLLGTIAFAQNVTYDYDRAANFSNYKTYAWIRGTELTDELNHARVVRAIDAALLARASRGWNPLPTPTWRRLPREFRQEPRNQRVGPWRDFLVSVQIGSGRRRFNRFWSERSSSTSPTHGRARSCGGAWPAVTSGQPISRRVATRESRRRWRRCSKTTRHRSFVDEQSTCPERVRHLHAARMCSPLSASSPSRRFHQGDRGMSLFDNPATIPTLSAFGGSVIGALSSTVSAWVGQRQRERRELVANKALNSSGCIQISSTKVRGCWSMPCSTRSKTRARSYQSMHSSVAFVCAPRPK